MPAEPLTADQSRLVADHFRLACHVATRVAGSKGIDVAETIDGAIDGLLRAARTFDPAKGLPFRAVAATRIRFGIGDRARYLHRRKRQVLHDAASINAPGLSWMVPIAPTGPDPGAFEDLLLLANPSDRPLLRSRFRDELDQRTIGRALGVTQNTICYRERAALKRLKARLESIDE